MKPLHLYLLTLLVTLGTFLFACSASRTEQGSLPGELQDLIAIVESGDRQALLSVLEFNSASCTTVEGLGGPPKCAPDEPDGTVVEVLPFLGPEGHFLRRENLETWPGLKVMDLFAVYVVSDQAYSDAYYPSGKYAIVFKGRQPNSIITLQVRNGKIVRIDGNIGTPVHIPAENVQKYLLEPRQSTP